MGDSLEMEPWEGSASALPMILYFFLRPFSSCTWTVEPMRTTSEVGVLFDDAGVGDEGVEGEDAAFDIGLVVLGLFILSVIHGASHLLGPLDTLGYVVASYSEEVFSLLLQPFQAPLGEVGRLGHIITPLTAKKTESSPIAARPATHRILLCLQGC